MVEVTANEIRVYLRTLEIAENNNLKVGLHGDSFIVNKTDAGHKLLGVFRTLEAASNFILGYDWANHQA
jgi:hypothetical protein